MMNSFRKTSWILLFLMLSMQAIAYDKAIMDRLAALPGISKVEPLESEAYQDKYVMFIKQQVAHDNASAGTFDQRLVVCHVGFDRPTILVTEGYYAHYALRKGYQEELSKILNANVITVEYRYFAESVPQPCNWDYLTVENSLYDLHNVNMTFRKVYNGKWIASGISKGGQTTMFYRAFFPDDVDVSVPYVAPLNKSTEDGRHEPFLSKTVGTKAERKLIADFQTELCKRKNNLMPMLRSHCENRGYTFRVPVEDIFDYMVLEYPFAIWQWGTPMSDIPSVTADDKTLFDHLLKINEPDYFAEQSPFLPFNVQAARELGYYGYDMKPFRKYFSIKTTEDYLHRIMLPAEFANVKFDKTLYNRTMKFLKENDPRMIYIYGSIDPWSASGVAGLKFLKNKHNIKVYMLEGGSHRTRINSFAEPERQEIISTLKDWLGM